MMTAQLRFFLRISGRACMPSISGISMSRMTTSGFERSMSLTARRPVRWLPTTSKPPASVSQREISPRTTTASSTIMTRMGASALGGATEAAAKLIWWYSTIKECRRQAGRPKSDEPDLVELRLDDVPVERLHDVFVRSGPHRLGDVGDVVLRGAEDDLRALAAGALAQLLEEIEAVHHRHVPIEEDRIRHGILADGEGLLAILGLGNGEVHSLQDAAGDLADDAGVVDDETMFHLCLPLCHAARVSEVSSRTRSTSRMTIS